MSVGGHEVSADPSARYPAEKNRYHLYIAHSCPFSQRVNIVRHLKKLQDVVTATITYWVNDVKDADGKYSLPIPKTAKPEWPTCTPDPVFGATSLRQVYEGCVPGYDGRYITPLLVDKKTKTIVSNDSVSMVKMLNTAFNAFCPDDESRNTDVYAEDLKAKIDDTFSWVNKNVSIGLFAAGYADNQAKHDEAAKNFFDHLEKAEAVLEKSRFLTGGSLTYVDICLYVSLIRIDRGAGPLFKLTKKAISDYPALSGFLSDVHHYRNIADTTNRRQNIEGLYLHNSAITSFNPHGLIGHGYLDEPVWVDPKVRRAKFGV